MEDCLSSRVQCPLEPVGSRASDVVSLVTPDDLLLGSAHCVVRHQGGRPCSHQERAALGSEGGGSAIAVRVTHVVLWFFAR